MKKHLKIYPRDALGWSDTAEYYMRKKKNYKTTILIGIAELYLLVSRTDESKKLLLQQGQILVDGINLVKQQGWGTEVTRDGNPHLVKVIELLKQIDFHDSSAARWDNLFQD